MGLLTAAESSGGFQQRELLIIIILNADRIKTQSVFFFLHISQVTCHTHTLFAVKSFVTHQLIQG